MERCVFRDQCKEGLEEAAVQWLRECREGLKRLVESEDLMTASVFKWKRNFFIYYECIKRHFTPEELFPGAGRFLEVWPGEDEKRCWVPMMDIYHCAEPVSKEFWTRKQPVQRTCARLTRLKPEMVSSYIFYHFQYQEEKPGDWSKYPLISLHENLMFFYTEEPDAPCEVPYKGRLSTSNTPGRWGDVMFPHFMLWDDTPKEEEIWRHIDLIYNL